MNYDRNRKTTFRRTSDLQIQYFERLNPEMECIYLLERRYQAGEDAPHSIPALRDYLSGKYNIPMFELEAMLQPLIDLENYVVSNLQVSEERLRFFFSSRGGTTSALAGRFMPCCTAARTTAALPETRKARRAQARAGPRARAGDGGPRRDRQLRRAHPLPAAKPGVRGLTNGPAQRCSIPLMTIWRSWTSFCARRRPCFSSMCRTRPRRFAAAQ